MKNTTLLLSSVSFFLASSVPFMATYAIQVDSPQVTRSSVCRIIISEDEDSERLPFIDYIFMEKSSGNQGNDVKLPTEITLRQECEAMKIISSDRRIYILPPVAIGNGAIIELGEPLAAVEIRCPRSNRPQFFGYDTHPVIHLENICR